MKRPPKKIIGALAILLAGAFAPPANADLFSTTDLNPASNIFECDLTAVAKDVTIGGATVHAMAYKDENAPVPPASAGIPIQVIKVKVGDLILCRFKNDHPTESASIHWHGIELDNDSDGTAVTQDAVLPGQSYTYRFKTFRPGVYWFHSHMLPGNTLFGGIYGVLIIENNSEAERIADGTVPAAADTQIVAMSDIDFDASGTIGKSLGGVTKTENELIELCHLAAIGDPGGNHAACSLSSSPGATVLVNGQKPDPGAQTPKFIVPSGKRVRLYLLNESIARHFRVKLLNSGDNKLYRIGGQGGLLDNIVLEGGIKGTWDTKYDLGEIVLGSGMRADTIAVPSGAEGAIIQLVGNPLTAPFSISTGFPANYPIAYFQISGTSTDTPPAAGDPILAGTGEDVENIKSAPVTPLEDAPPFPGSSDETIKLLTHIPTGPDTYVQKLPTVDDYVAPLDVNTGNGDWLTVPRPPTARYAHIGDVLELTVRNDSDGGGAHPYHLHGFSMQPVRMVQNSDGTTLYNFNYDEFVDTVDVYGGQSFVFRTRIDDRPKICDLSPSSPPGPVLAPCSDSECGGVVGRWLYHCHIVNHGALGMISEVTILPDDDLPPEITCPPDVTQDTDPGECTAVVTFDNPTAIDDCGPVEIGCDHASGEAFPKGVTVVTCTATDTNSQTDMCSFNVTVEDNEAPQLTSSVTVPILWSPSHDLVNVGLKVTATDNCDANPVISVKVFGNEDDQQPTGDGTHAPDARNIAPGTLRLRSERNGTGTGRLYLIVITATDADGNKTVACQTVVVPKSQSKDSLAMVNSQATAARAYCDSHDGAPPPGFFVIGDGPVIGPKQ